MDYKFCPKCGQELQPNSNACTECGTILNEKAIKKINSSKKNTSINLNIDKDKIKSNMSNIVDGVRNKKNTKFIVIGASALVVIVIAIIAIVALAGGGNSKNEQSAIEIAENYYSEHMSSYYDTLTLNSTIAASNKAGNVYIVDVSIDGTLSVENYLDTTVEDSDNGILVPVIMNEDGTGSIAPDISLLDNSYYSSAERQEKLAELELEWINAI